MRRDPLTRFAIAIVIALVAMLSAGPAAAARASSGAMPSSGPFAPPGAIAATTRDASSKVDDTPPDTRIDSGPRGITRDVTPTFELSSTEPGSTFECRIDDEPLADCTTPFTAAELSPGPHTFRAHAQDVATNFDPSPATRLFTVAPDLPTGRGPSAACHVTDGEFTLCPDGKDEWSDIAPASFPDTEAFLYADQADLVPGRATPRSPVDTLMLVYDECARRTPLKRNEFFVVSFDTTEHEPGEPVKLVRYVVHVFGDGTLVFLENGELEHADGGAVRAPEIDGQHAAAGFGPSPDCSHNHLIVEYDIELEAAGGHSYSPAPAWWSAHAPGGGGSGTNPGTPCPRLVGPSAAGGSSPWAAGLVTKPGTDIDKDGLDHADERRLLTDACHHDTDGDGLIDSWEIDDASVPGAGFDLDGNGRADVPSKLVFGSGFDAPSPLRKDVYVEVDSYDCNVGGCPKFDPMVHMLDGPAKTDLEQMFAGLDMSLHIIDDEHIVHRPNCDRPPAVNRGGADPHFGTSDQRALGLGDLIRAKELAFRYAVFAHSTRFDDDTPCLTPGTFDLATTAVDGSPPLPAYDLSPFGSAVIGGRDMIVSLSPLWICPSDVIVPNPRYLLLRVLPVAPPPITYICFGPRDYFNPSIFPADVAGRSLPAIRKPYSRLLGASEANGTTQLLGRSFAHLLGHLLGLDEADVANKPQQRQMFPPLQPYLKPQPYPGAAKIQLGGDQTTLLYTIDSSGTKLRFTPRVATGATDEDTVDSNPITETQQTDTDGDGVIETDDNCTGFDNPGQEDLDADAIGDACDNDIDGDGQLNATDPHPADTDDDGIDNLADADDDGDVVADTTDNCKLAANASQTDTDGDLTGDACDADADADGTENDVERAVGSDPLDAASVPERVGSAESCSDGTDDDGDGQTDGADPGCADSDGDSMPDESDPCPTQDDAGWNDADADGLGDACDPDADNDAVTDVDERNLGSDPLDATSVPEARAIDGTCQDGVDNDRDGLIDNDDPRCLLASKLGPPAIRPGFDSVPLAANDDDSTGPVSLGFEIGFGGQSYSSAYLNNNGNLTFDAPLTDFVPFDLKLAPDPIIAPFFGDVDTRDGAVARYGTATVDGRPAFGVTWPGVGCYPRDTSVRNAFQAVLVNRSDVAPGAFDVELNYDQIEWNPGQLGSCSGGVSGRPVGARAAGVQTGAARAGYSDGTGLNGAFAELDGSGTEDAFIDANLDTGLVHGSRDSAVPGRYVFRIRPPSPDGDGDGIADEIDNCPQDANPGQQDTGLIGIGDACRPERHTTAGFLNARLDGTTGVEPTSTLLSEAPSLLERLVRIVADDLRTGYSGGSPEDLTASLVDSLVDLGLVSAADAPKLRADVLDRVLGPRTPPPPPPPPPGLGPPFVAPPPPADTTAPILSRLYAAPRLFPRAGGARTAVATRVRYTLSEAARVRFEIQKPKAGRLAGGACKPPARALARAPRCTRYKTVTLLGHSGGTGANTRIFNGFAGSRALIAGRYRVVAVATDAAGNRSRPRSAFFRVVRP